MDFLNTAEKRDRRMVHLPMGRFGEAVEVAKGALFRTCRLPSFALPRHLPALSFLPCHCPCRYVDAPVAQVRGAGNFLGHVC